MKRIISFLMVIAIFMSLLPIGTIVAFADGVANATLVVESVSAAANSYVDVTIEITENPGIASMGLTLTFDEDLTLVGATNGAAFSELTMTPPAQLKKQGSVVGSCRFAWLGNDNCTELGTILTLRFQVSSGAVLYKDCPISISCDAGDILDNSRNPIELTAVSGKVTVIDYVPGDVDDSGYINMLDVLTLCQYYVDGCKYDPNGYGVNIIPESGDVDANGKINMLDALTICQYYVDDCKYDPNGYGVKLLPGKRACNHTMQHFDAKAVSCTEDGSLEYWYCSLCKDYFADAVGTDIITYDYTVIKSEGHNYIAYEAEPAGPDKNGYTAGVWCDKCEIWTSGHEYIPPIEPNESNISYRHYVKKETITGDVEIVNDNYLSTQAQINNPNPITYKEGTGIAELIESVSIEGKQVTANGYSFLGWYEKPELTANRVYSISPDATGDRILYGIWTKDVYTITYLPDSATSILPKIEDGSYTVDKETALEAPPSWPNMVWVGWSDENGRIVKSIPKGTTGNITLTANWMSRRSQTVPNTDYASDTPAITIDAEKGIYAFTYEIGDIQNVPIQQIEEGADGGKGFNLVKGAIHEISTTYTQKITEGEAVNVANTIANATTKSDSWTLSEDWSKSTTFSQEHSSEVSQEQSQTAAIAFSESNKFSLSSGVGGSEEHTDETGKSVKTTKTDEFGVSVNVGSKTTNSANVGLSCPFTNASLGVGGSKETSKSLGLDYKHTNETTQETNEKHTDTTSSYWNVNRGFETSNELSQSHEFSSSLSQSVKDTYSYGETLEYGGSTSKTASSSNTASQSREYSSSVDYSTEEGTEKTINEILTADADTGWYRKVIAANFKVFAVVIYDMKTNTYSTMTYSLMIKDSEHLFTDYSTVSSFNDYENGVLPFEVPFFVSEYVYGLVGASDGLKINDETGVVESYGYKDPATGICYKKYNDTTGEYSEPCDTDVIIPRFYVADVSTTEKKIVPVTGIAASVFSGTNVTSVYLSDRITEIPEGAFENCTSLKYVRGGTIETIGKNAFKNCTSLFEFILPSTVTSLGEGAFEGSAALTVYASNVSVVDSALVSGVKQLSVNLEELKGTIDGKKIIIPKTFEYFSLSGGGKTFSNVSIESEDNALIDTVVLNNITIQNNSNVPVQLNTNNLELSFTTIKSNSLTLRLDAENTVVTLDGNNYLTSSAENAALSQSVRFYEKQGSTSAGKLNVTGNFLIYGSTNGVSCVSFDSASHSFVFLTEEEYNNMLNSHYVHLDANGGTVTSESKLVMWNCAIGALPTPTREGCTFLGWYREDGTAVTENTVFTDLTDITVKAYWQSGWVLASELPENAQVTDRKWRYTKTETTESTSSSMTGWTQTGNYWKKTGSGSTNYASFPSGFDTGNWYYQNFAKSAYSAYDNGSTKREVSNTWAGYIYWHWMYNVSYANTTVRTISHRYGSWDKYGNSGGNMYQYFFATASSVNCPYLDNNYCCSQNLPSYNCHSIISNTTNVGTPRCFRFDYYTSTYIDYQKIYQYQKVTTGESATEMVNGGQISDVHVLVKYTIK